MSHVACRMSHVACRMSHVAMRRICTLGDPQRPELPSELGPETAAKSSDSFALVCGRGRVGLGARSLIYLLMSL